MRVYEIRHPGTWLDGLDDELAQTTFVALSVLEAHLADAAMGLAMFEEERARPPKVFDPDAVEAGWRVVQDVEARLALDLPLGLPQAELRARRLELRESAELIVKREEWAAGKVPDAYRARRPFIHAHTVLYALDGIFKGLVALGNERGLTPGVAAAATQFAAALPSVVAVRNSAHHIEDRVRRRGQGGRDIDVQPAETATLKNTGDALILSVLEDNRLGYTLSDGYFGQVEISDASVRAAQAAIQTAVDALDWRGWPSTVPH